MATQAQDIDYARRRAVVDRLGKRRLAFLPVPHEVTEEAARLWAKGLTKREMAQAMGRSLLAIKYITGKPANRRLFPTRQPRQISDADKELILHLYECGCSTGTIGKHVGFHHTTVYQLLQREGVEIRSMGHRCITKCIPPSEIARCRREGLSFIEMGRDMGQSHRLIETIAYRCGLTLKAVEETRDLPQRIWDEYRDALDDLRNHADALEVALEYTDDGDDEGEDWSEPVGPLGTPA